MTKVENQLFKKNTHTHTDRYLCLSTSEFPTRTCSNTELYVQHMKLVHNTVVFPLLLALSSYERLILFNL